MVTWDAIGFPTNNLHDGSV